jgi:predicted metalloendopeptidase
MPTGKWLIVGLLGVALGAFGAQAPEPVSGLDLANFDRTVRPQDDLFRFVNGAWLARTPIPPDRISYGTFLELADRAEEDMRAIIEATLATRDRQRGSARQIADLYASLINLDAIEKRGLEPVRAELARLQSIESKEEFAKEAGRLSAIAAGGPFPGTVEELPGSPGRPIVNISQGGTLLPDRDYYLKHEPQFVAYRAGYVRYMTDLFVLSNLVDRVTAERWAERVLALEVELATVQWSREGVSDPARTARTYTLQALEREMPGFDWTAWARPQGIDVSGRLILSQPSFFKAFASLFAATPLETWKAWLVVRFMTANAPYLPQAFSDLRFEFFGRMLTGQELPRTHWKRGVGLVNAYLGDAAGRLYVERHFSPNLKARAERLVQSIVVAFKVAIQEAPWLTDKTRRAALDKLSRLSTKVGYPDRWRDYRGLDIRPDDLFGNVERAKQFDNSYRLSRFAAPPDAGEWLLTPQTVNAYYSPARNEVVVPAALLQPPLFNAEADDAVNYGAIGAVIGHEIGHGFDERGRRFDGFGAARNWWTADDEQAFDVLAGGLIAQYNGYSPIAGARVNGLVTLRENIGDLSGLAIAWRAYQMSLDRRPSRVIDGFTGEQRFFLGWAQAWRGSIRAEYLRQTLLSTPHAPPQYRSNGPASNLPGFYEAFGVQPGDGMFIAREQRTRIW